MAGQEPAEARMFPIGPFLGAWMPEEEPEAAPAPAPAEVEEIEDQEVEDPEGLEQLAQLPQVLAALRGAEMITLQEVACTREASGAMGLGIARRAVDCQCRLLACFNI